MAIKTRIFAPPEQLSTSGEIFPCSDLYSLAVTCVCLLTGKSADDLWCKNQKRWIWKQHTQHTKVSAQFVGILDRMLLPNPSDRFQSAGKVITALSEETFSSGTEEIFSSEPTVVENTSNTQQTTGNPNPPPPIPPNIPNRRMLKVLALIILGLVAGAIALLIHWWLHLPICDLPNQDGFSCGERILIQNYSTYKRDGVRAFGQGHFDEAIQDLTMYLSNLDAKNDPEARIYLNNAIAAKAKNPLKIAVIVPINSLRGTAEQMLRGIAHVQDKINNQQLTNNKIYNQQLTNKLFIEIASYFNETDIKDVTQAILDKDKILGVIGFYTSNDILEATKFFKEDIVVISPTSNATRDPDFKLGNHVFRTAVDNSILVEKLVKYMLSQKPKEKETKAAILYQPDGGKFVKSFSDQFEKYFLEKDNKVTISRKCQVTNNDEVSKCLQQVKHDGTEVIVLAFNDIIAKKVAIPIIQESENLIILGSDTLYGTVGDALKFRLQAEKLRIAIPWHRSNGSKSNFEKESEKLWGTGNVNWETAASYDATMAMVEGLRRSKGNYTRQQLYKELKNPAFSAEGVAAKVQFDEKGDRKPLRGIGVLVKVENNRFVVDEQSQQ